MIISHLSTFVHKRLDCVRNIDQKLWPDDRLELMPFFSATRPSLRQALMAPCAKVNILVEVKKASPSLGELSQVSALELCKNYVDAGALALSVLVDQPNFKGHPQDLLDGVTHYPQLPFLFKDFVASAYQVRLAKALGASAVLLMSQLLEWPEMQDLFALAGELGLEAFVECHDIDELERALALKPPIVGINSRDFKDPKLSIDLGTTARLLKQLSCAWPAATALVAQSGLSNGEQLQQILDACPKGLPHAVQIGSSLSLAGTLPAWLH